MEKWIIGFLINWSFADNLKLAADKGNCRSISVLPLVKDI